MSYLLNLLILLEIYMIVAMSLNLLIGYAGLMQVAHAAYFGVGAYAAALLWTHLGAGFLVGLAAAAAVGAVVSLMVSLPAWKLEGDYFVMISLAVQVVLYSLMYNWVGLTNGPYGIAGIPGPHFFGINFVSQYSIFVIYGIIFAIIVAALAVIQRSPFGRSLRAVRDDELAARSLGIPVRRLKVEAFMVASAVVAVAGGMFAAYFSYIDPTSFSLDASILMLSMVIVGGTGNVRGPLLGAVVLVAIPEILRFLALPDALAANIRLLAYGLLLMGMMRWRPQGLAGNYRFE